MMKRLSSLLLFAATAVSAQPAGKFPPDSLINTKVIPHSAPVMDVIGTMRNFTSALGVRCQFCHVGSEGQPLAQFDFASDQKRNKLATPVQETAVAVSADSALAAYKVLRDKYYGRDAYDFSESSLNIAAFRTARAGKVDEALKLLKYNETLYPNSSGMSVFKGNIQLMKGDTVAAEAAFREALKRDSTNTEARGRLQAIGKK